jgi:hypothetical protein
MMGRFGLTFWVLRKHPPFNEEPGRPKPVLTAVLAAFRNAFATALETLNDVADARFIATADTESLDERGAAEKVPRYDGEPDDNYAVEFSGNPADYVQVPYDASLDVTTVLTVDVRFNIDSLAAHRELYSRNNSHQELRVLSTGVVSWEPRPGVTAVSAPGTVVTGKLYHARAVYDSAAGAKVYLGEPGGVFAQVATAAPGGLMTAGAWFVRIGQRWSGLNPMYGVIDEVRAVSAAVPTVDGETEVPQYLMPITATRLLLHFDEGAGSSAADSSGCGNDAALEGAAAWFDMSGTDRPGYRVRLDEAWRDAGEALTLEAIENAIEDAGAEMVPVLTVDEIQQRYEDRWLFYKAAELDPPAGGGRRRRRARGTWAGSRWSSC